MREGWWQIRWEMRGPKGIAVRLAAEFCDLADLDRSLLAREKQSVAAVLAARSWVFSIFAKDKKVAG